MRNLTLIAACVAASAALMPPADAAEKVYKWTDANGVVHFSKYPPKGGNAESMTLRTATPATATSENASADAEPEGELYAEAEPPDNRAIEEENRARQCARGQAMIAQIEPRPRVFRVSPDGTRTYLSDQERLDLLEEARQLVNDHCDS